MAELDLSGDPASSVSKPVAMVGNVTITGNVVASGSVTADDFAYSSGPFMGELFIIDTTLAAGQATGTTAFTKVTQWQAGTTISGVTVSTANSNLVTQSSGWYEVALSLSLTTTVTGTYEFQVFSNDTTQNNLKQSITLTDGSDSSLAISGLLQLETTASVDLRGISTTASGSMLISDGNFYIHKVG
jgi:hypothetical protein